MDWEAFLAAGALSVLLALVLLSVGSWVGSWLIDQFRFSALHRPSSRQ
ncbi:hypothetical protein JYB87_04325 [Shewanella avicenniae]|uniref:Uncharacterized protein n=1 Tax=Shewanella avicenniae TaxID=2814294 RepID=A0ABX7QUF5_9GAMM|nr:hypothetical protein [Shewanella avicenniae]QSX34483.1 hypothetical protein JYB87_04325 [Shewanella avicenniae]